MAKLSRLAGSTSHILTIFVQDSSQTDGRGLTGLTSASAGLTCYYKRNTASASTAITLTGTGTLGTYASGLFKEIDATNMPGLYELDPPDAAYASGAKSVAIMLKGATNMAPVLLEIELTAVDNQDGVRYGMTALPNANAAAPGGLPTVGAGAGQINAASGKVPATLAAADVSGNLPANVTQVNAVSTSSVTTIGANVGTAQPVGFTGTGSSALVKTDVIDVAGSTASTFTGTAQAGTANTITLAAGEAANAKGREIDLVGGTGAGQSAVCVAYNAATKVATIICPQGAGGNWATNPDATTQYAIGDLVSTEVQVEAGSPAVNMRQAQAVIAAATAGTSSGVSTGSPVYKGAGTATTRISATAANGDRSAVTLTVPT